MSIIEEGRSSRENRSFSVDAPAMLDKLLTELSQLGQIKGIGFDVFGTILNGSLNRFDLSAFLSNCVATYYKFKTGKTFSEEEALSLYLECRESLKDNRSPLLIGEDNIPAKEQEIQEIVVLEAIAKLLQLDSPDDLISNVQSQWLLSDLQHTKAIDGMLDLVKKSVILFGRDRVSVFSNHSFSREHLLALLRKNQYLSESMLSEKNVFLSSDFGIKKFGVGLRKPNQLAFREFSAQMLLKPQEVAFIGDSKHDSIFATNSGGVGILV